MSDIDLAAPLYGLAQTAVLSEHYEYAEIIASTILNPTNIPLWNDLVEAQQNYYDATAGFIDLPYSQWAAEIDVRLAEVARQLWYLVHPAGSRACESCLNLYVDPVKAATLTNDVNCGRHNKKTA